jgi:isocitrate dehydrogenase
MSTGQSRITYTLTDEAPLLATVAFLPVIRSFAAPAGIEVEKADISVAARVLAEFGEYLTDAQKDAQRTLADLGRRTLLPETNIIKLPNISASVAQLVACVRELQSKGYKVPDYPEDARTDEAEGHPGSLLANALAVLSIRCLREGNSDRRAPRAVKEYARKNPHSMGEWKQCVAAPTSRTCTTVTSITAKSR